MYLLEVFHTWDELCLLEFSVSFYDWILLLRIYTKLKKGSLLYLMFVKLQIFVQAHQSPPKVTVAELLQQLTVTQAELENVKVRYYIHFT